MGESITGTGPSSAPGSAPGDPEPETVQVPEPVEPEMSAEPVSALAPEVDPEPTDA